MTKRNQQYLKRLGRTVKRFRLAEGLSLREVADRSGLSAACISITENGGNPRMSTICDLAAAFRTKPETLIQCSVY